jgi:cell division septal protein FtsQ
MPTHDTRDNNFSSVGGSPSYRSSTHKASRSGGGSGSRRQINRKVSPIKFADVDRKRGHTLIVLALLCGAELLFALFNAPALNVRHTKIEGITDGSSLTQDEIRITQNAAALPAGTNWLRAPVGQIHANLASLPWLRSATVGHSFPMDINIVVEPRAPAYSLITAAGRFEMGADNTPIRQLRREMENRLKPIFLNSSKAPKLGAVFADTATDTAAQILHRTQADAVLRIAKIEIDQSTNIWLNMSAGIRVKFGLCDDVDKKITMLRKLLSHEREARFSEINLSCPDWPAGTLKNSGNNGTLAAVNSTSRASGTIGADRTTPSRSQSSIR